MPNHQPPDPGSPRHETIVHVHYRLTDRMGVVYYANYLELFEIARSTMIRDAGWSYLDMERAGFGLPVVRAEADYLRPAFFEDRLVIATRIDRLTGRAIDFRYEIFRNEEPDPICRGRTRHLVVGLEGRPRRLDDLWLGRLRSLLPQTPG